MGHLSFRGGKKLYDLEVTCTLLAHSVHLLHYILERKLYFLLRNITVVVTTLNDDDPQSYALL